ncbi:MAG TPA: AmmeMemoRadiSam system protein A [Terriglobales bacterium]
MSRQPEDSPPNQSTAIDTTAEYSPEERAWLLKLVHDSIAAALERRQVDLVPPNQHLAERRAVFTTLYSRGRLRGCVGHVIAAQPLWTAVADTAQSAAFEDSRFQPVTADELPHLTTNLSILSALEPIRPECVEIGRHGLLISWRGRRGLLLPQVPVEHGWDRETFLSETCHKAGLPRDAWRHGAEIEAFTAEVFGEHGAS